jgi:hypothetical protein
MDRWRAAFKISWGQLDYMDESTEADQRPETHVCQGYWPATSDLNACLVVSHMQEGTINPMRST